jgi:hypothetical protein
MKFDYDKSWDKLTEALKAQKSVTESWAGFLEYFEKQAPKKYWELLKNLDLQTEQGELKDWLESLFKNSPIPDDTRALWIGIMKVEGENDGEIPAIYLIGSNTYDEENLDWAASPTYLPENRYVCPGILQDIDNIIKTDKKEFQFLDWILPVAYCGLTIDEIFRTKFDKDLALHNKSSLQIVVGHDGGDYLELSPLVASA